MNRRYYSWFPVPAVIVILGLAYGLLFVFLIPPWQHNDEPGHFEYVWLIANRPGWPKIGDYDPAMRRAVLLSMLEHGSDRFLIFRIDLIAPIPNIGNSQVGDPPVYYWLASLPLRFMHGNDVTSQLYASRLVSMILYLATILLAWGFMRELTPGNKILQWVMPVTLILLPGFTDLMTAVNNDVGAILAFSFFLWATVRLFRRGITFWGLVFLFGAAALCYWTKNDVWLSLLMLPIVLLFTLLRGRWRLLAWVLFLTGAVAFFWAVFLWGDAAMWFRHTSEDVTTRVAQSSAPVGGHAFQLKISPQDSNPSLLQPLPSKTVMELKNGPVTLGAWVWASQPSIALLQLSCLCGAHPRTFDLKIPAETKPKFYMFTPTLPESARRVSVVMTIPYEPKQAQGTLFYDGLVLIKGKIVTQDPPRFEDPKGEKGIWDGLPFTNLLLNPSAEQAGPRLQPWAYKVNQRTNPYLVISDIPTSLFDWEGAGGYYRTTISVIFRTFWAKFGWGNAPLLGSKPYRLLAVFTLIGLVGAGLVIWRKRRSLPWELLLVLVLALLGIWASAILRGLDTIFYVPYFPVARYAYPAILPTILILSAGWLEILRILGRWLHLSFPIQVFTYLICFAALDIFSVISIIHFYYT